MCIRDSFSGRGETEPVVSRYTACDVLVIDDLGKEDAKEWSANMMFLVINTRYEDMRPTIFTSNYPPQALSKRLGRKGEIETCLLYTSAGRRCAAKGVARFPAASGSAFP